MKKVNYNFASLYPSVVMNKYPNLIREIIETKRKRLIEQRKQKLKQLNENQQFNSERL